MIVDVAVPYRVPRSFHYAISDEQAKSLTTGSLVRVPFGSRKTHAYVLGLVKSTDVDGRKLKSVESILVAEPLFDEDMLRFLRWVAGYYCHPLGEVIATAIPKQCWDYKESKRKKNGPVSNAELGLASMAQKKPQLNGAQLEAVDAILSSLDTRPFLLHGITASGKTEVYMSVIEQVLSEKKGAIVLVPEISLTPQLLGRFSSRFPEKIAVWHSSLTPKERRTQWDRLHRGEARIVIGARSAVFAPVKKLGILVVDEEHEGSFKQEDSVRYHGRDLAILRGHLENAKVVLGTATPSVESYFNAQNGKYHYLKLSHRIQERPLPKPTFVDIKDPGQLYSAEMPWLSKVLAKKIEGALGSGEQTLLFLNRLGFAHFLYCQDCGHTLRCRHCDVSLTYYQSPPRLKCHYCNGSKAPPEVCEACSGSHWDSLGFGTEQVEKGLVRVFPSARIARMDRSVVRTRRALETLLEQIGKREIDIVIGTQMLAKGHDFPGISLVGILVADASLNLPDFRAQERTFQMITQVSGRAGRAEVPGEVVIQTVNVEHPVLRAAVENRPKDFYSSELESRRQFGFPPFSRMAMLRFQHSNASRVRLFANEVVIRLQNMAHRTSCELLGPCEAPLSRVKNLYRWQCLVKCASVKEMTSVVQMAQRLVDQQKSSVQMFIDVDPVNLW